jgi:colanic acid/amylovoran biosynthesis protein
MPDAKPAPSIALLVNCWHDSNKGDAAISIGVINALKQNAVASKICAASYIYYPEKKDQDFGFRHVRAAHPDVRFLQTSLPAAARSVGKLRSLFLSLRAACKLIWPGLVPDREFEDTLRTSRVVVSNGGLYFGFAKSGWFFTLFHLFAFSYPLLLAKRCGVPFVLYAQSFGPFRDPLSRWWMRRLVAASAGAWARESFSRDALLRIGAPAGKLDVVADAAFGLKLSTTDPEAVLQRFGLTLNTYVAISARGLGESGHNSEAQERYRASIARLIESLTTEVGLKVVLVAHTTGPLEDEDDRTTTRAILASVKPEQAGKVVLIEEDLSPEELVLLYGSSRFVLATRFHAVVLSICGGAPAIAIPYFGLKTQGSMRDLGLAELLLEVSDLSYETLMQKCADCMKQGEVLRSRIRTVASDQYAAAMHTGHRLANLLPADK